MTKTKKNKFKVSPEVAEEDFYRWTERMDIETDPRFIPEKQIEEFEAGKMTVVKNIARGHASVDAEGMLSFVPSHKDSTYKETLIFRAKTAQTLVSSHNTKNDAQRLLNMIANLTDTQPKDVKGLAGSDLSFATSIMGFLVV